MVTWQMIDEQIAAIRALLLLEYRRIGRPAAQARRGINCAASTETIRRRIHLNTERITAAATTAVTEVDRAGAAIHVAIAAAAVVGQRECIGVLVKRARRHQITSAIVAVAAIVQAQAIETLI